MITIIDYGLGNLGSVKNILKKLGYESRVSSSKKDIESSSHIVLPGVGAFDTGMNSLKELNLVDPLNYQVLVKEKPVLGICLGAQLMTQSSEEGKSKGLGWFNASTEKFKFSKKDKFPLPNIGWREVYSPENHFLLKNIEEPRFYFVHSYKLVSKDKDATILLSKYENEFCAGLSKKNIHCVQFHPEKSHIYGMKLLKNFFDIYK